jgi:uncharacterized protein DUF6894
MPLYTFKLQAGECPVEDETGVWFDDRDRAVDHAQDVARQLMTARERETRAWRLDVYENGQPVCQIPFATIDPTLDHLHPHLRSTVEASCESIRSFKQVASAAHETVRESRALVARARGRPYLATERGQPIIRPLTRERKEP